MSIIKNMKPSNPINFQFAVVSSSLKMSESAVIKSESLEN